MMDLPQITSDDIRLLGMLQERLENERKEKYRRGKYRRMDARGVLIGEIKKSIALCLQSFIETETKRGNPFLNPETQDANHPWPRSAFLRERYDHETLIGRAEENYDRNVSFRAHVDQALSVISNEIVAREDVESEEQN